MALVQTTHPPNQETGIVSVYSNYDREPDPGTRGLIKNQEPSNIILHSSFNLIFEVWEFEDNNNNVEGLLKLLGV